MAGLSSICVNRGYEPFPAVVTAPEAESLSDLLKFYNPTGGPVRKLATYLGPGGGFRVNVGHAAYFDLDRVFRSLTATPSLDTGTSKSLFGGGKGPSLFDMLASSLGEGVERVVGTMAHFMGRADQQIGSYNDLTRQGVPCLSPDEMPMFSATQYAQPDFIYDPFTKDAPLAWIEGERLVSGEPVWVPGQLVEMLHLVHGGEATVGYAASGGLSCHVSRDLAIFHGVTELIERDAINLRWYLRIPPDEILIDERPRSDGLSALLHDLSSLPGKPRFFYHSLDLPEVPVVTVIQLDPWLKSLAYSAGGGVDTDAETAVLKALTEYGQTERTLRMAVLAPDRAVSAAVERMFTVAEDTTAEEIALFIQVIGFYGYRHNRSKLDWYLQDNSVVQLSALATDRIPDAPQRLGRLLDILGTKGVDPIVFDFTPPGLATLRLMKVFIPELTQPFLQSKPMFGHPRFGEIAAQYGEPLGEGIDVHCIDPLPYP